MAGEIRHKALGDIDEPAGSIIHDPATGAICHEFLTCECDHALTFNAHHSGMSCGEDILGDCGLPPFGPDWADVELVYTSRGWAATLILPPHYPLNFNQYRYWTLVFDPMDTGTCLWRLTVTCQTYPFPFRTVFDAWLTAPAGFTCAAGGSFVDSIGGGDFDCTGTIVVTPI